MGLLDGLIAGAVAGIVASVVGATAVTATVIGVATTLIIDDDLWKKINTYLCSLREKTLDWLKALKNFATTALIFTVSLLDKGRACANRARHQLCCKAVSENKTKEVFMHVLSSDEMVKMGLTNGEELSQTIKVEDL